MSIRDDLAELLLDVDLHGTHDEAEWPQAFADAVLAYLMGADKPWVLGSEPHMDGSHTVSVAKYHDGRPGTVTVRVPAGYVLAKVWP